MMKRIQITAAILAALFALTACSAASGTSAAPLPDAESGTPAAAPSAEEANPVEPLRAIDTTWSASVGEQAAYSAINLNESGVYVGTRIDFATGQQEVLCQKAGCPHSDESCPAFLWKIGENVCIAACALLADGDKLYWVVEGRYNGSAGAYVDVSDTDGQNRRRLAEGEELPELDSWGCSYFAGEDALYILQQEQLTDAQTDVFDGIRQNLYRVTSSNGVEKIGSTPPEETKPGFNPNCWWYVGCWQGQIALWYDEGYEEPVIEGEATEESLNRYYEESEARSGQSANSLYLMDSTGQLTETGITWKVGKGVSTLLCGDFFYMLGEDGRLRAVSLANGQEKEYEFPLDETVDFLYKGYGNCLYVQGPDEGNYLWNLDTGAASPIEPTWYKDQVAPRGPTVVAAGETMLLVVTGAKYYTVTSTGKDGIPYSFDTCDYLYGLIPAADFFAGGRDWVPVTLLGRDLV